MLNNTCSRLIFNQNIMYSFPRLAIVSSITTCTISGIIAFPTFYINLLVIWTILEKENLRSSSYNLLLAILSLTDLLVGLVVQPLFITVNTCIICRCTSTCNLLVTFTTSILVCVVASISTLVIISVERYLSIKHPLYYTTHVTTKKLIAANAIVWVLMIFLFLMTRFQFDKLKEAVGSIALGLSIIVIVFCLAKVSLTARRHMRAINAQQAAVQPTTTKNRIKEYRHTFILGLVALTSAIVYLPALIVKIIGATKGKEWNEDFKYISQQIFLTFLHLQSLVNPLILSLRLSYIRAGVKKNLCWFRQAQNDQ